LAVEYRATVGKVQEQVPAVKMDTSHIATHDRLPGYKQLKDSSRNGVTQEQCKAADGGTYRVNY
jgi:hypothetical protein